MQWIWLVIAVVSTVGYHVVMKLTPAGVNPYLTLAISYAVVTAIFLIAYAVSAPDSTRAAARLVNWTAFGLAATVVLLDLGFLMLYRSGFDVSLGQIVTQSAAALALLFLGVALFRERLSLVNAAGILLCIGGLWLISRR
ncbi:MAG: EamA family transporter [Steroidobacteraceae bacterium]